MNFDKRLSAVEKCINTRIVKDYYRALELTLLEDDVPNLNALDEDKLVGNRAQTALADINLLTHEERMKFDPEYARQEKIKLQKEKEVIESNSRRATDNKSPRTNNPARKKKNCHSRKPGNIKEKPKQESQREENPRTRSRLTDEEILRWDPDNLERIRQIEEENDRKWEAKHGGRPLAKK